MAITYEEAVNTLCGMFESWDRATIVEVFKSTNYHLERTIEMILTMDGSIETPPPATSSTTTEAHQSTNQPSVPAPSRTPPETNFFEDFGQELDTDPHSTSEDDEISTQHRGIRCQLPDDFLRAPNYNSLTIGDEQLALMLQNEMFLREVHRTLGDDLFNPYGRNTRTTSQQHPHPQGSAAGNRAQQQQQQQSQPHQQQQQEGIPDMGILKGLSEMGTEMRKQLNNLALRFNTNNSNSNQPGGRRTEDLESVPLTSDAVYEEEEDDFESFDNAPKSQTYKSTADIPKRNTSTGSANKKDK